MLYTTHIIIHIVILINLTLIGGILPLIERKYLSLIQRRVGPKFLGYKGRLQFIADALKMFLKGVFVPTNASKSFFHFWPVLFLSLVYLLHLNIYWNENVIHLNIEYNLLFLTLVGLLLNICIFLTGYFSKNKYASISSTRSFIMIICCELLIGVFYLSLIFISSSLSINSFGVLQEEFPIIFHYLWLINLIIILVLLEVNKSPFDLTEAETELVTGFHTEYGAFFFALFYLGEYFHIFFTSAFIIYVMFGY
jgi:NADH:ubiquinone oxidoreductase subunit H